MTASVGGHLGPQARVVLAGGTVRMITYESEGHSGWSYENDVGSTKDIIEFLRPHLTATKPP